MSGKNCGCSAMNADGSPDYNPAEIASWINKYIYDGKAEKETIKEAYVKVMVWIEAKNKPFTEDTISSNKDELKVIVNDPNFLENKKTAPDGYKHAIILILIAFAVWYFAFRK
jgi:hypothetical protein